MKSFSAVIALAGSLAVCASAQVTPDFMTGQAARLVIGQRNFTQGDYGATNQLIGSPGGIALVNGTLWVVDANRQGSTPNNNRVLRFSDVSTYPSVTDYPDIPGSTCSVCRGVASLVLGQPDFISGNQSLSANGMRGPTGVASDGKVLVVSDTDNNRVLVWLNLPTHNGQPADVVIGQPDFVHNATSVPPTAQSLRGPEGVWIQNGKLFIADSQDNRILVYNKIPTSNYASADLVIGQPNFTSFVQPDLTKSTATPAANNMQTPVSVTSDGTHLFVTDLGQSRVLIYNTIPTANGASADVVIGQPDMVSATDNNATALCASQGTDSNNNPIYPTRCSTTLSFPRFALSDGKRLFVADGGNDRVLVYNKIPTTNGVAADVILGQPDDQSDDDGENPDGTNAFQTPNSLAWDGQNLYVSDSYNRRIVVYSPALRWVSLDGVRNAASLEIYGIGEVDISGTITANDTVTITINSNNYKYTVQKNDTLDNVVNGLVDAINKAPDPAVSASANLSNEAVILTAKVPGLSGASVSYSVATSNNATVTASATGSELNIYLENPSQLAPGTVIVVNGVSDPMCDTTQAADLSKGRLPIDLGGCRVYIDGIPAPLFYVSAWQINAQVPFEVFDRTSVTIWVRSQHKDGTVGASTAIAATIVPQNPGIFAAPGVDPRPGYVFHGESYAVDVVSVDGTIQAQDVATVSINDATYTYPIQSTDTLQTVRDGLIAAINANGGDPNVIASAANEYTRIILTSRVPGIDGEGVSVTATETTNLTTNTGGATIAMSVFNPTLCCTNTVGAPVTIDNPAQPGELVYVLATGLGLPYPSDVDSGQVTPAGNYNPLAVPVDSILTGGTAANIVSSFLTPGSVGVYTVQFMLNSSLATNDQTQMTIAQQSFVSNVVTFPVGVPTVSNVKSNAKKNPSLRRK